MDSDDRFSWFLFWECGTEMSFLGQFSSNLDELAMDEMLKLVD